MHYLQKTITKVLNISASSTVKKLLTEVSKVLPGRIESKDLIIKHGNTTPLRDQPVVFFSLEETFHISE